MKHVCSRNAVMLLAGVIGTGAVQAQTAKPQAQAPIPAITDWSSRSVIQHTPKFPDEFERSAAGDAEMARLYRDPRYTAQVLRRIESELPGLRAPKASTRQAAATASATCNERRDRGRCDPAPGGGTTQEGLVHRDWSNILGNGNSGGGVAGMFPAKYTFDINAAPSCANDFVVYATNAVASTEGSGQKELRPANMTSGTATGTITIGSGVRSVTLTASGNPTTNLQFSNAGTNVAQAAALATAVNVWSQQTGIFAEATASQVSFFRLGAGDSDPIAITENLSNLDLADPITGTGTSGQPSIIAFNQLYNTTCNATRSNPNAPNVMWAYFAGADIVETSPVLSYYDNGQQVAFIQRVSLPNPDVLQLVLLKWRAGDGTATAPVDLTGATDVAPANYRACAAPCMTRFFLSGDSDTDDAPTFSSPYVDYTNDVLWVGDGNGQLHKFTGVFQGTPAEITSGGFPATVATGLKLSPPVEFNGQVYVGSQSGGAGIGGKLHRVDAATGAVVDSVKLANNNSAGILDGLIVDSTTNSVFAFLFNDGTAGNSTDCGPAANNDDACRVVARFAPGFAADAAPLQRVYVGRGNNVNSILHSGAFDDAYYSSGNGTGAMYIVGGTPVNTFIPTLWKIPFINGVAQAPQIGPAVGVYPCGPVQCLAEIFNWSPVTTIKNGTSEYLYFSMNRDASAGGCTGACLYMFNLNALIAGSPETWTFTVQSPIGIGITSNVTINTPATNNLNVVITASNTQSCTPTGGTFDRGGNQASDAANLRACLQVVPGFTVSGSGNTIILTNNVPGNVAYTVTQSFDPSDLTLNNVDGVDPSNAWSTAASPRAALQIIGGTGGIIVDNVQNGTTGAQQIYTTSAGAGGNAIQASQSGLQ